MKVPAWAVTTSALILALPFGWGLGLVAALIIAGKDFGQLPAATVPLGLIAAFVFALRSSIKASTRLLVLSVGSVAFVLLGWWTA